MSVSETTKPTVIYGEKGANLSFRIIRYALLSCLPLLAVCIYVNNYFLIAPVLLLIASRYMTAKYWKTTPYVVFSATRMEVKPSKVAVVKVIPYEDVVSVQEHKRAWSLDYTDKGKEKQVVIVKFWLTPEGIERVRSELEQHVASVTQPFQP
ncbi:hypothetical protein [Marinomonas pollencensis]|uniref:Uncharacterized protein n=1 Tax=Marinomonas pollencensis TaxID=491954 RepID=A0A3E0DMI9_9GAMM|nr:hypothetical protein [Marinomonas pollencensis]REG83893.1 hypothetical protein DFP81_105259 [Marinomonas pollencensis]